MGYVHVGATACLLCSRYMACATYLFKQVCLTLWDGVCCVGSGSTVLPTTSLSCCGLLSDCEHSDSTVLSPPPAHSSQHLHISYIPVCLSIPLCSTLSSSAIACSDTSDDDDGGVSSDDSTTDDSQDGSSTSLSPSSELWLYTGVRWHTCGIAKITSRY